MKYCANCGHPIQDESAKFCSMCASPLPDEITETPPSPETLCEQQIQQKKKRWRIYLIGSISIVIVLILFFVFTQKNVDPVLYKAENMLNLSCEDILRNEDFRVTSLFGVKVAKAKSDELFGIHGEYKIFITEGQEYVQTVTWESRDGIRLSDDEIDTFLRGMRKAYGILIIESDDGSYVWENNDFGVMMDLNNEGAYIMWIAKSK